MQPSITLTGDQQNALDACIQFILDPIETAFVLSGYSGTGKSTLVKTLLERLPTYLQAARLIDPQLKEYTTQLTATTNKAAETFSQLSGMDVLTIHSFLGLRVHTDYQTNVTTLIPRSNVPQENMLIFIDEASYVDKHLLNHIFKLTRNCKIVFIGDPAQLTPVKANGTPVFEAKFSGAHLSQVVRQAEGNPIIDLSTKFRNTVNTGEFFKFQPDGKHVIYLDRADFNQAIEAEFTRPDWCYQDSKILGWTNKCAIDYNHMVSDAVKGNPNFQVGDYVVCNKFISSGRMSIKTDQLVHITAISAEEEIYGVTGRYYTLDNHMSFFSANSLAARKDLIKRSRETEQLHIIEQVDNRWIDLRAAYACTINKAQGSTYERAFIDLDDIRRCNSGDQIARMLYVGVSRARQQVFLTGDLV